METSKKYWLATLGFELLFLPFAIHYLGWVSLGLIITFLVCLVCFGAMLLRSSAANK